MFCAGDMKTAKNGLYSYIFASIPLVINNYMMMAAIALVTNAIERHSSTTYVWTLVIVCVMALLVAINRYVAGRIRIRYFLTYMKSIRQRIFESILRLPYNLFAQRSKDIYASRMVNDINTVEDRYFEGLADLSYWCVFLFVAVIVLGIIDPLLLSIIIPVEAVIALVSLRLSHRIEQLEIEVSQEQEKYTTDSANLIAGLDVVRLANLESTYTEKNRRAAKQLEGKKAQYSMYKVLFNNGLTALASVMSFGIIIYLYFKIIIGYPVAVVLVAYQIGSTICYAVNYCVTALLSIRASNALSNHIEFIEELKPSDSPHFKTVDRLGPIVADKLSFSYEDKIVFHDVNFVIESGRKYLIVGPSGCGKTTLLNLLSGVQTNYVGSLSMNGVQLNELNHRQYLEHLAIIEQDTFLFESSLRNNLTLFDSDVADAKINEVVEACRLTKLVERMEHGLDEELHQNGKNLSGGERQRIAIARAIIRKADMLLADEPTASLDETTAEQIEKLLLSLPCTVITISHRRQSALSGYDFVLQIGNYRVNTIPISEYSGLECETL